MTKPAGNVSAKLQLVIEGGDEPLLLTTLPHEEVSEPDPLDEDDHRGRMTGDGYLLTRNGPDHWHWRSGNPVPCSVAHDVGQYSLDWWGEARGPLTFAPDTSPSTQDDERNHP